MLAATLVFGAWGNLAVAEKESDVWLDLESKSLARANAQTLAKLDDKANLSAWNSWVASDLAQDDWLVERQTVESYSLRPEAGNYLGKDLVASWSCLVESICAIHNEVVGMRVSRAGAVYSGDERLNVIHARLRAWADAYIEKRLLRTAHRQGGPVKQYQFIYAEFLPHLDTIAFRVGSANRWLMSELADYFPTQLFERTCASMMEYRFDEKQLIPQYRANTTDPLLNQYLLSQVNLYQWQHLDDTLNVCQLLARKLNVNCELKSEEIRERIRSLVSDIQEMRPFLRTSFKPENLVVEIAEGVFISFHWAVGRGVGFIPIAPTRSEMMIHHRQNTSALSLLIGYDGLLSNFATPWIGVEDSLGKEPDALAINLRILEVLHAHLFALYEKVDVAAILARLRKRLNTSSASEAPTEEEFAATCTVLAESASGADEPKAGAFVSSMRAVRVQRLFAILRNKLNCEVRQGKGSEMVIYREGGHHFRLGQHKGNNHVPIAVIKNILRHVGIDFAEWLDAIMTE